MIRLCMIEISSKTSLNIKIKISIFLQPRTFYWFNSSVAFWLKNIIWNSEPYPQNTSFMSSIVWLHSYTRLLGFIPFVTRRLTAFTSSTVADRWDLRFVVLLFSKFGAAWIPQKACVWSKFSSAHEMVLILSYERNEQHVKELASRAPNVHRI